MVMFRSTRSDHCVRGVEALYEGLAPDGGLYVPVNFPELVFDDLSFEGIATEVLHGFFDDFQKSDIREWVNLAYGGRFPADPIPVKKCGSAYFLELFHGPTAAFKDVALSILPYLLTGAARALGRDERLLILTATSGDTGKAALSGFADVADTEVAVFYPIGGTSEVQRLQMVCETAGNAAVFGIEGNFDDAQRMVKAIFADEAVRELAAAEGVVLTSANSINPGRLVPQISYYLYSWQKLVASGELAPGQLLDVVVPTGNFGNLLAAYYARAFGLPVRQFICASNQNHVLSDFLTTGVYHLDREFYKTTSPSMDILVSSNLERLLFHCCEDAQQIKRWMDELKQKGRFELDFATAEALRVFYGGWCSDPEAGMAIREYAEAFGYAMDPHTAVAAAVLKQFQAEHAGAVPALVAATASCFKFPEAVLGALDETVSADLAINLGRVSDWSGEPVHPGVAGLSTLEVKHPQVIDVAAMRDEVIRLIKGGRSK